MHLTYMYFLVRQHRENKNSNIRGYNRQLEYFDSQCRWKLSVTKTYFPLIVYTITVKIM